MNMKSMWITPFFAFFCIFPITQANEEIKERAQADWKMNYMPDGFMQAARSFVLLEKAAYGLSKAILDMTSMSFTEMALEVQRRTTDNGYRRSSEDDPMLTSDLDWDETKCLFEEYGTAFIWKGSEIIQKYWSKSKRCGDI